MGRASAAIGTGEPALRELGERYEEVRARIGRLVADVDDPKSVIVPACPRWSVHDLISHLTGNCANVIRGDLEGVATDPWTAAQVEERKDRTTAAVLAEWAEVAPPYAAMIDDFPGLFGRMTIGDITAHEHDLRGAIGKPGQRGSESLWIAIDFLMTGIVDLAMRQHGLGPLEVRCGAHRWIVGTGEAPTTERGPWQEAMLAPDTSEPVAAPVGSVTAEPFELFRAVTGRRSARQIRSLEWTVDPSPYVAAFGGGPFTVRATDLYE